MVRRIEFLTILRRRRARWGRTVPVGQEAALGGGTARFGERGGVHRAFCPNAFIMSTAPAPAQGGGTVPPLPRLFCATVGAVLTSLITTPMEVVKTRLQVTSPGRLRGVFSTARAIVRGDEFSALWHGLAPSLLMSLPSSALYFTPLGMTVGTLTSNGRLASMRRREVSDRAPASRVACA